MHTQCRFEQALRTIRHILESPINFLYTAAEYGDG
jgi:hypothetical protein